MWLGMAFMIHVTSVGGGQLTPEGWRACPSKKWTLDLQFPVTVSCLVFVGQQISTGWQWCLWKTQAIYVLADDLIDACWTDQRLRAGSLRGDILGDIPAMLAAVTARK
eukprot:s489_g9.t2